MEKFRILLVIDNFETLSINGLRPLLTSVPHGSKVLITYRVGLGELEIRYKLDPLDSKTAVALARKFAKSLNVEVLVSAADARLEKYTTALYRNPLLIKWFVQSVAGGADPDKLAAGRGPAFESAIRFCFENLFSRLSSPERDILHFLAAARKPLYSSSRLVTLCLSSFVFPAGDEFQWGEVGEGLVWADGVVDLLPVAELAIEDGQLVRVGLYLVELFVVGAMGTLHMAIELR